MIESAGSKHNQIFAPSPGVGDDHRAPKNRREVATAFEKQLLEQFVGTMMEGVFDNSFAEAGPLAGAAVVCASSWILLGLSLVAVAASTAVTSP